MLKFATHLPLTSGCEPFKLCFEACAQLSLLLHHVVMQLVQGLIEAVDSTCVTFAKGVANLKVDVSKIHFFQKLIFKDTTRKTSKKEE